jgi:predicted transcriptional regulator
MVAGVAGIGLMVLKFLIAPFFTRLTKEEALEHPRRKTIFQYIQQHPGANFREIARNTSIAAGTVRHHLNVLERSGQIVEHNHGSTVRLFENHGKFANNWADLVLLREPALGQVHAWLKEHPASPQKAILEAMETHGWSRSTTQHRLSRLVDGGLANIKLQGRLKIYTAAERPPGRPQHVSPGPSPSAPQPV